MLVASVHITHLNRSPPAQTLTIHSTSHRPTHIPKGLSLQSAVATCTSEVLLKPIKSAETAQ